MDSSRIALREISYQDILSIWTEKLWPQRKDPIRAMSSMIFPDGNDMKVYDLYEPTFFGLFDGDRLVGVNSGHRTSDLDYRSRGLYVEPEYRNRGLAQLLLDAVAAQGAREGAMMIWSYPKRSALNAYLSFGFLESDISPETETHCYVWKRISPLSPSSTKDGAL